MHEYSAFITIAFDVASSIMSLDIVEKRDFMTPIEILHKIVDTEESARSLYDEAVAIREGFEKYVQDHVDVIRKEHFERADQVIAAFEVEEKKRADDTIVQLDEKLAKDMAAAKDRYVNAKDEAVQKIFKLAVDFDA